MKAAMLVDRVTLYHKNTQTYLQAIYSPIR